MRCYNNGGWFLQVVQEIKILRSNVSQREREKAERATLVTQERLVKSKVTLLGLTSIIVSVGEGARRNVGRREGGEENW